jgi:hypothetical protein
MLVLEGVVDVALFIFVHVQTPKKSSLQFSCNFAIFNASEGSLPDIWPI